MAETFEAGAATLGPTEDGRVLESVPKELGVLLVVAGIGGILLPGPVGAPLLIMGGAILCPSVFRKWDRGFQKRFPKAHGEAMHRVKRFVTDLERRYPTRHRSGVETSRRNEPNPG